VTITHPHHPLRGQRVTIVRIRQGTDPDLIVQLPDGTHAARAMSSTDYAGTPAAPATPSHLLALDGLRRVVHLRAQWRQPGLSSPPTDTLRAPQRRHTPYDQDR
jgi:hypothetical protein